MYDFIYQDENEFRRLERGLKIINMVAYKKLVFEIYPSLKKGDFSKVNENDGLYEIELPTDNMFARVYGKYKLIFEIIDNNIKLIELVPKDILLASLNGKFTTYRGVVIPIENNEKYKFKIDLLDGIIK